MIMINMINEGNGDDDGDHHVKVERHLLKDIMQSTKPWIEELMTAGYKVILSILDILNLLNILIIINIKLLVGFFIHLLSFFNCFINKFLF